MRGIPSSFVLVFFLFVFIIELGSYFGIRAILDSKKYKHGSLIIKIYLFISILISGVVLFSFSNPEIIRQSKNYTFFLIIISAAFINLIPKIIIAKIFLLSFIAKMIYGKRAQIISIAASLIFASGVLILIFFAAVIGKNNIAINTSNIEFESFPKSLNELTIVQLSDIHLGSFGKNTALIEKAVEKVNAINPDIVLFTGDIVNNFASEFENFVPILKKINSKYGKYAISGNHDYGDYSSWVEPSEKVQNLNNIHKSIEESGFKLLLNSSEKISIGDTSIYITGVENWGHNPFPKYADLNLATETVPQNCFKILLTHDPAHWEAEIVSKTNIQLTLSGHTHGAQFGINFAGINFSIMYLIQKYWGGLYKSENQYLYVNTGLGTVGFPGRIDMNPEITVLKLSGIKNH